MTPHTNSCPPLGFGLGLRAQHYDDIINSQPVADWFEIISENYMYSHGRLRHLLEKVRARYPIVMHGVSLSIGTIDPLNSDYLYKLRELEQWLKPAWVSDHLCWTGVAHKNTHDLLPLPYTEEALSHVVDRIKKVQDFLGRTLVIENPSTYLEFSSSYMPEEVFLARMADESGCGLLLDVNNIYVSCFNHKKDCRQYIDTLPLDQVWQIHLAGHSDHGTHLFDTHSGPVIDAVWDLYKYVIGKDGIKNTMIEWDENIPTFDILAAELQKARQFTKTAQNISIADFSKRKLATGQMPESLGTLLPQMQKVIIDKPVFDNTDNTSLSWIAPKESFSKREQVNIYVMGYRQRLFDIVRMDYPALRLLYGDTKMDNLLRGYVHHTQSTFQDASLYSSGLESYLQKMMPEHSVDCELARLEYAIAQIEHMAENPPADHTHLQGIASGDISPANLIARPALMLLSFNHDISDLYSNLLKGNKNNPVIQKQTFLAVLRHDWQTWRYTLTYQEYQALQTLKHADSLEDFLATVTEEDSLQSGQWLARWIENGFIAVRENTSEEKTLPERITA